MDVPWAKAADHAARQLGLVTWNQLRRCGLSNKAIRWAVRRGQMVRLQPGVYLMAGAPGSIEQSARAVLLSFPKAVVSHRAAARQHGLRKGDEMEVTVPRGMRPRFLGPVTVHHLADLRPEFIIYRGGLKMTTVPRTLVDLAAVLPPEDVAAAIDKAFELHLVSPEEIDHALRAVARRGRRRVAVFRAVLHSRVPDVDRTMLEKHGRAVLDLTKTGNWTEQPTLIAPDGSEIRPDALEPEARVVAEWDGFLWHRTPAQLTNDHKRQNLLTSMGYVVMRYGWFDLTQRQTSVATELDALVTARLVTCAQ